MRPVRFARNVRLGVKDLMLHKLRSLLTTLGVVFGVASVIAMLGVGEGASQQALDQIRKLGSNNIILTAVKPMEDEDSGKDRSFMSVYGLLYEDEQRIRESLPSVARTVPVRLIRKDAWLGERTLELRVVGTTAAWFDLVRRPLLAGRVLLPRDSNTLAPVCVLTEHGARRLLATERTIGETIRLGDSHFEVVGIVKSEESGGGFQVPDEEVDAYIPMSVSLQRFGEIVVRQSSGSRQVEQVELHQLLVEVNSTEQVEPTASAIESLLGTSHRKKDYRLHVPLTLLRQAESTKRTFTVVLGSIAGISLLVGGIGIMNIMLASVTERTREIGVRRAIGAKRRQIIGQFLVETMVLSGIGGVIGVILGVLIPWAITRLAGIPTVIPLYSLVLSFGISVAIGIVFGLYPAVRAANLDPIEALRHE